MKYVVRVKRNLITERIVFDEAGDAEHYIDTMLDNGYWVKLSLL